MPALCGACGCKTDVVYIEGECNLNNGHDSLDNTFSSPLVCMNSMKRIQSIMKEELNIAMFQKNTTGYKDAPTKDVDENDCVGFRGIAKRILKLL